MINGEPEIENKHSCCSCKIGDTCDDSDKGISWTNTHKCFRYEWLEKENKE